MYVSAVIAQSDRISCTMNASEMAGEPPRPPDQRANPFPPEKPGKRALWELLTHHHPQGATVATLSGDSRLQEVSSPTYERQLLLQRLHGARTLVKGDLID